MSVVQKLINLEQMKKEASERMSKMGILSDASDIETETKFMKCFCSKYPTEHRIDEREVTHNIGDRCNPSFHRVTNETVMGWWCNECDSETQIISQNSNIF